MQEVISWQTPGSPVDYFNPDLELNRRVPHHYIIVSVAMGTMDTSFPGRDLGPPPVKAVRKTQRYRPFIHYETFVWVVYGTFAVLAVVDRFVWNVWPRETYRIGTGTAGSDFVDGLKAGPWSVKMYDAVARISGRFDIVSLNLLLFTMSHTTYDWLSESWLARNVFDMRNYKEANRRLHKWNGIGLIVATLLHVWSIVFPCITHGWKAQVVLGHFEWILSERGPKGFKDINLETKTMSLQGDDVFRIIEMTILLAILLPLSVKWLSTRWHLGVQLHSVISILYFIDIVRRHTHPHSWILNTPFFLWWVGDVIAGVYLRREKPEIFRVHLSNDYMLLFWNQIRRSNTVGPKYYLKLEESSRLERAHVFTGFENRTNLNLIDGKCWSACLLVRVYHSKRRPRLGKKDSYSHTQRVAESTDLNLWTWGPFLGDMSEKVKVALEGKRPVSLIAGGSAAGYIIDAIQKHGMDQLETPLTCLYTCRDPALFHWVSQVIAELLRKVAPENIHVIIALTDGGNADDQETADMVESKAREVADMSGRSSSSDDDREKSTLTVQYGRINFPKQIPGRNIVYFQGSGGLQKAVHTGCKVNRCRLVAGPAYDQDEKKKKNLLKALNCFDKSREAV